MFTPRRIKHRRACGGAVSYRRRPTTTATARTCTGCGARSMTRTRSTSSARCRSGTTRCCSAGATSSRGGACGRCRRLHGARREHDRRRAARDRRGGRCAVEMLGLFTRLNVVRVGQVHMFYRARLLDTDFAPGPETIEAQLSAKTRCRGPRSRFGPRSGRSSSSSPIAAPAHSASTLPTSPSRAHASARRSGARCPDRRGCAQDPLVALRGRARSSARRAQQGRDALTDALARGEGKLSRLSG